MGTAAMALRPESMDGADNGLTQYLRSLTNSVGTRAPGAFDTGTGTFGAGINAMQPSLDFFQKLLAGDRSTALSALAPQVSAVTDQANQQREQVAQGPRGGGTASALVQQPQAETAQLTNLLAGAQTAAAPAAANVGATQAGLGTQEQGVGLGAFQQALNGLIARRQQNTQVDMNNVNNLTKGLGQVYGALV